MSHISIRRQSLTDLATHEELRACLGTTARQRVADHFQLEQMVAKTVAVYQRL